MTRAGVARSCSSIPSMSRSGTTRCAKAAVAGETSRAPHITRAPDETYRYPVRAPTGLAKQPVVIGTGPCGIFAGLSLARMGFRPIILERGRIVRERTHDVQGFWRERRLNRNRTCSSAKAAPARSPTASCTPASRTAGIAYDRFSKDFVDCGAPAGNHLYQQAAHRHAAAREGGRTCATESKSWAAGSASRPGSRISPSKMARCARSRSPTAHTSRPTASCSPSAPARDTFEMLHARGVHIEAKPFSIGFRIEHPQDQINRCRLGARAGNPALGAARTRAPQHNAAARYSFCMCPGGQVVAAASEAGGVVTNGMSHCSRNERNANAGRKLLWASCPRTSAATHPLAGIVLQRHWKPGRSNWAGGNYNAPAQLVGDFLAGRSSTAVVPSFLRTRRA